VWYVIPRYFIESDYPSDSAYACPICCMGSDTLPRLGSGKIVADRHFPSKKLKMRSPGADVFSATGAYNFVCAQSLRVH
jgi:hypothetical protein